MPEVTARQNGISRPMVKACQSATGAARTCVADAGASEVQLAQPLAANQRRQRGCTGGAQVVVPQPQHLQAAVRPRGRAHSPAGGPARRTVTGSGFGFKSLHPAPPRAAMHAQDTCCCTVSWQLRAGLHRRRPGPPDNVQFSMHSCGVHILASSSPKALLGAAASNAQCQSTLLGAATSNAHLASAASPLRPSPKVVKKPCWVLPQKMRTWPGSRRPQAPALRSFKNPAVAAARDAHLASAAAPSGPSPQPDRSSSCSTTAAGASAAAPASPKPLFPAAAAQRG